MTIKWDGPLDETLKSLGEQFKFDSDDLGGLAISMEDGAEGNTNPWVIVLAATAIVVKFARMTDDVDEALDVSVRFMDSLLDAVELAKANGEQD